MINRDEWTTDPSIRQMLEEPEAYLKDDGFVNAVMNRVPSSIPGRREVRRRAIVFGLVAVAACTTMWMSMDELLPALAPVRGGDPADFAPITGVLVIGSCVLLAALYPVAESLGRALALRRER